MDTLGNVTPERITKAKTALAKVLDVPSVTFDVTPQTSDAMATGFEIPGFKTTKTRLETALSETLGGKVKGLYTQNDALNGIVFEGRDVRGAADAIAGLDIDRAELLRMQIKRLQETAVTQDHNR